MTGNSESSLYSSVGSASLTCLPKFHVRIRRKTLPELSFQFGTSLPPRIPGVVHSNDLAFSCFTAMDTSSPDTID